MHRKHELNFGVGFERISDKIKKAFDELKHLSLIRECTTMNDII